MSCFRIKSSRPVYRRAGLDLSGAWLETDLPDLGPAALARLFDDPIVVIQRNIEGEWEAIPARVRKEAADLYRAMAEDADVGEDVTTAPLSTGAEPPSADGRRPVDAPPTLVPEPRIPLVTEPVKPTTPSPKADRKKVAAKAGGKPGR